MQPINRSSTVYNDAQILAALTASVREISFRYELLDQNNGHLGTLGNIISCSVAHNTTSEIKRTARITMTDRDDIDWANERIRPWFRLKMDDEFTNKEGDNWVEWPLGNFLLSTPRRLISGPRNLREIECYDQSLVLRDDKSLERITIAQDTNVIDAVQFILASAGITNILLTPTSETLPNTLEWPPGTSKLRMINDMLHSINYWPLIITSAGTSVARPYTQGQERPTEYTYVADGRSVLVGEMTAELDYFDVPNVWVGIVSEPDRPPMSKIVRNDEPLSPTSTVARGRDIVKVIDNMNSTSEAVLEQALIRRAVADMQGYEAVTLQTALMPRHEDNDLIAIDYNKYGPEPQRFVEQGWSMNLKAGELMTHTLSRIVRFDYAFA